MGHGTGLLTTNCHLYHYAGNNPVVYTDPDGRIKKNYFGEFVFDVTSVETLTIKLGKIYTFKAEVGFIYADDGTPISVWRNLSPDVPEVNTNCFGLTFTDGKFWITDDVQKILDGDNYKEVNETDIRIGDVEIYKNQELGILHTDTICSIEEHEFLFFKWKTVMVKTLGGAEVKPYETYLHDGPTPDVKPCCEHPEIYYRKESYGE